MIETYCQCGNPLLIDEIECGQAIQCPRCDAPVLAITAEMGTKGDGDFDACLVITKGPENVGRQIFLGGVVELTIGKQPDRSLVLPGKLVSRNHCRLKRVDFGPSRWIVEDNRSTNGLYVNGQKIDSRELAEGDVIRIGDYELTYGHHTGQKPEFDPLDEPVEPEVDFELAPAPAPTPRPVNVAAMIPASGRSKMTIAQTESINRLTGTYQAPAGPGPKCPSCSGALPVGAKICVKCGIDLKTGRPLLTSRAVDEEILYENARSAISVISWLVPIGIYPIASEAFGVAKPIVLWLMVGITTLISTVILIRSYADETGTDTTLTVLDMALWAGSTHPVPGTTGERISLARNETIATLARGETPSEFSRYFSCTLVHADWMHLVGNMLFFIIFGVGLNRVLGNIRMAIVYPLLALGSGLIYQMVESDATRHPLIGASGAIMGLAGMYVILFPLQRIHMAAWFRLGFLGGLRLAMATNFRVNLGLFAMRGFWVVAFYIGMDVVFTLFKAEDGVAHWAHLGGFITGVILAIVMLVARQIPPQGDLLSLVLGKHAWAILGKPANRT